MPTVLFVMPDAFHLGWMGETRRLFHFASAFKELGSGVVLLAGKRTDIRLQGDIDRQFPGFVLRTQHTGAYPRIVDVASLPRRAWRGLWKMWGREYYATRLSCGWAETMDNGQVFRELDRHAIRPDLIWGVSAGYLDGATAADNLARALGVPWILELHDPPRGCGLGPEWVAIRREFSRLLARSVRHVVTTDSYRRHLIEDFGLDAKCVQTVHGPFDGEIQAKVSFGGNVPWRIVYVGSLGGGRSLAPLVYGYCKALNRQPCIKGNSRIEIAGTGPGAVETRALARVLGIGATVRIHGAVPKERADELVRLSSVSVVVQSEETSAFQIPGKVFQYMSSGNPILAIMPECEAAAILRRSGLGFVHPQGDIDGIADTLVRLWTDWRAGRSSVEMDRDYVRQFSSKNLPEKLRLVLEGLL